MKDVALPVRIDSAIAFVLLRRGEPYSFETMSSPIEVIMTTGEFTERTVSGPDLIGQS